MTASGGGSNATPRDGLSDAPLDVRSQLPDRGAAAASAGMTALCQFVGHNSLERDRYSGTVGGTVPILEYYAPKILRQIRAGAT